jgi:hypothetical protein
VGFREGGYIGFFGFFFGGGIKGGGGRPLFGERVGGTHFSARENENTGNKGNFFTL